MAFSCKAGTFTQQAGTGDQAVTGVGFQPKALLLWGSSVAEGFATTAQFPIGMAVSDSSFAAISGASREAQATMDTRRGHHNTACYVAINTAADSFIDVADLTSFDSDGFTPNWSVNAGAARIINYLALGGADLTNVAIKEFTSKTSTGNESYTGVGFQPDCIILFSIALATAPSTVTGNNTLSIGWALSSSAQGVVGVSSNDNVADCVSNRAQRTSHCIYGVNNDAVLFSAELVSMDADGFTLNYDVEAGAGARYVWALCLKGGSYFCGADTEAATATTKATTGLGFAPKGLLLQSFGMTATTSLLSEYRLSFGAGSSATSRNSCWNSDVDASATSNTDRYQDDASIFTVGSAAGAVVSQSDLSSLDADGFTLNRGTDDGTDRQFLFLAFGDTPVESTFPELLTQDNNVCMTWRKPVEAIPYY